jgi:hypothetical protein
MARSIAQNWFYALGVSLCACLCSACTLVGGRDKYEDSAYNKAFLQPDPASVNAHLQDGWDARNTSYHKLPTPVAEPDEGASPVEVRQGSPDHEEKSSSQPEPVSVGKLPQVAPPALAETAAGTPDQPVAEHPLLTALRSFLDQKPQEAIAILGRYEKPNQEMLLALLPLAKELTEISLTHPRAEEIAALDEKVQSMERPLRQRMQLVMNKICFCESIKGFCDYVPFAPGHPFRAPAPGRPDEQVNIYVELSNLSGVAHVSAERGSFYETRLASSVKIVPQGGKEPIWQRQFKDRMGHVILSRTLRHDYFNSYMFYVPHIPPGAYKLVIEVTDVPTGRTASRSLDFRVTALPLPG